MYFKEIVQISEAYCDFETPDLTIKIICKENGPVKEVLT